MKILVAGTRTITDRKFIEKTLRELLFVGSKCRATEIVSGMCRGPDMIAHDFAVKCGIPVAKFPADWKAHGTAAGPIRNEQMAEYADEAIVFWDGWSKGTSHMIKLMRDAGKPCRVFCHGSEM